MWAIQKVVKCSKPIDITDTLSDISFRESVLYFPFSSLPCPALSRHALPCSSCPASPTNTQCIQNALHPSLSSIHRLLIRRKHTIHIRRDARIGLRRQATIHHRRQARPLRRELRRNQRRLAIDLRGGSEEQLAGQLLRELDGVAIRRLPYTFEAFSAPTRGLQRGKAVHDVEVLADAHEVLDRREFQRRNRAMLAHDARARVVLQNRRRKHVRHRSF